MLQPERSGEIVTRPPKGYRWGEATIERWELAEDGKRRVEMASVLALIHEASGFLGLHKPVVEGYGLWTVVHLPSGRKIATLPTQARGRELIGLLSGLVDLASSPPQPSTLSTAWGIVSSLLTSLAEQPTPTRRKRPTKQPRTGPSSFSPVFQGYVPTPANRAAQNKAALALGQAMAGQIAPEEYGRVMHETAAIAWREEIVVRVTQAPRAILLETDIPTFPMTTRPSSSDGSSTRSTTGQGSTRSQRTAGAGSTPGPTGPCLRDGTPATPGEFRRRHQALLELGDRLRAGSLKFQTFYAEGEREGWTSDRLDRWGRIDERFRTLVCEGWMIWSGAAFCFDCAPAEFQANVVAKLGYIGSREQGYHELGIKTFLRWPEIMAVQPLRREMREKVGARL